MYFDSCGFPPPNVIKKSYYFNDVKYQDDYTSTCGYYALRFCEVVDTGGLEEYRKMCDGYQINDRQYNENALYEAFKD